MNTLLYILGCLIVSLVVAYPFYKKYQKGQSSKLNLMEILGILVLIFTSWAGVGGLIVFGLVMYGDEIKFEIKGKKK
jgi:hypothetical protein